MGPDLLSPTHIVLAEWEFMWQMKFNIDKCFILRVGRPKHKLVHLYTLHNQNLSETDSAKYLGLTITSDLQWNQHINNITNTANSILGLLRRNLRIPSQTINTCLPITSTTTFGICFYGMGPTYPETYTFISLT